MQSLKNSIPNFLRTDEQIGYYNEVIDTLVLAQTPIRDQDCYSIGMLALNLALMDDCANSIAEHGMMMQVRGDRAVISKVNPAVALQKEAQTALRFYFDRFQMSPNSRGNIGSGLTPQPKGKGDDTGIGSIKVSKK